MEKPKKFLPRHRGATIKLANGTGRIVDLVPIRRYVEAYKQDWTFRIYTPETTDPDETLPDVPWSVPEVPNVGSSNPIVARLVIQSWRMMGNKLLKNDVTRAKLINSMHDCKEELVACERIYQKLKPEYDAIVAKLEAGELENQGKVITPFPCLHSLKDSAAQFLVGIKRALQNVAEVFCTCYPGAIVKNGNFSKAISHLEKHRPELRDYILYLQEGQLFVTTMVDLRNGLEHPDNRKTHIHNFRMVPDAATGKAKIAPPMWHVDGQPEAGILHHMPLIIESMIRFAEENFLFCLSDNLNENPFGYRVDTIAPEFRDPECPIRYMLVFGIEQPCEAVKRSIEAASASPEPTGPQ